MEAAYTLFIAKKYSPRRIFGKELPIGLFPKREYVTIFESPDGSLESSGFDTLNELVEALAEASIQDKDIPDEIHRNKLPPGYDTNGLRLLSEVENMKLNMIFFKEASYI